MDTHSRASLPAGEDALGSHYSSPSETHGPQLPSSSLPYYLPHPSSIVLPAHRPSVRETRAKWNARDGMRVCGHKCVPTDTPHILGSPQLVTWCQSFPSNWPCGSELIRSEGPGIFKGRTVREMPCHLVRQTFLSSKIMMGNIFFLDLLYE